MAKSKASAAAASGKKSTPAKKKKASSKPTTQKNSLFGFFKIAAAAGGKKKEAEAKDGDTTPPTSANSTPRKSPAPAAAKSPSKSPATKSPNGSKSPLKPALPSGRTELTTDCPSIGIGWTQRVVARGGGITSSVKKAATDRYYFSPEGRRFRSMKEVRRYLDGEEGVGESPVVKKRPVKKGAANGGKKKSASKKGASDAKEDGEGSAKKKESAPKKKKKSTVKTKSVSDPKHPIGTKVSKVFEDDDTGEDRPFSGVVEDYNIEDGRYSIVYEDGDKEDVDEAEMEKIVVRNGGGVERKANSKRASKRKGKSPPVSSDGDEGTEESEAESSGTPVRKQRKKKARTTAAKGSEESEEDEEMKDGDDEAPRGSARGRRSPRRSAKKRISYVVDSDTDEAEFDDDDESSVPPEKKRGSKGKKAPGGKAAGSRKGVKKAAVRGRRKAAADSDSDEFEPDADAEGDDDSFVADTESEMEVDSDDDGEEDDAPKKRKGRGGQKKATKSGGGKKKEPAAATKKEDTKWGKATGTIEELCRKKLKDAKPLNNPQKLPKDGPYVEPVGIDATDGIVEGIIGGMVQKVGKLLHATLRLPDEEKDMGELNFPIKLNTACSGTDAPSIALGLVKETLDRLQSVEEGDNGKEARPHGFDYEHNMSCEIEPFKQAYIGRNFPGVLLFPDICKLTKEKTVVDVYGREQTIPEGNLFVAGTSCKDFSMLKSACRKDIEDKGTSGETFLAAVEYLEQEKPAVAIFENVDNAPWDKMQEYIRGRLILSERNSIKNITEIKKDQADADNDLKFTIDDDGRYIVEEVPRQVGVRAGCVVQGFVRGDDDPSDVTPLTSSPDKAGKIITLGKLAKEHGINLEEDILVMEKKARYCTQLIRLDTKEYGLPQTRNRQYLFVWRSDDPADDLGEYFMLLMNHLKTPLLHSMEAFMLPPTHDRIRCFREALRSGPGLMVAKERAKELDFFDWELSGVKDLAHHLNYRKVNGIEERSRWLTQWGTRGRKQVAPGLWPELVAMWNMRRRDLIDCFSAVVARDAISRDSLHHSFTWDLSQNVTRAVPRTSMVGVSGCVTPGGELLLPHKGRTMMGFEKLLLQGIPFTRLALGPETEVQLSDLAGNAMSMSVVCATMLSAICAPQLRREQSNIGKVNLAEFKLSQKYDEAAGAVLAERGDLHGKDSLNREDFVDVFGKIADELAEDAFHCSVLCNSESSGQQTSSEDDILECVDCGFGISAGQTKFHQVESHNLKVIVSAGTKRANPHEFEMKLRRAAPSVLVLGDGWEDTIKECKGLESYTFQLQKVSRNRGHWLLTYGAWEDHGRGRQVAEIRVALGQLGALDKDCGLTAYVKCFAPAIRHNNPKRGKLGDSARLILRMKGKSKDKGASHWEICDKASKSSFKIVGSDPCDSHRVQIGVNDLAQKELKKHKYTKQFTEHLPKTRNDLLHYHSKWKTWPGTITISGDDNDLVNGTYKKMTCTHTTVLSALWRRAATNDSPKMYLFLRPDVMRTGLDVAVISPTPSYRDGLEICELKEWIPENALVEKTHTTEVKFLNWKAVPKLSLGVPEPSMLSEQESTPFHQRLSGGSSDPPILCKMSGLTDEVMSSMLRHSTYLEAKENLVPIDLVGKMGSRNAKQMSILAAPSLLKFAAEGRLPIELLKWYGLEHPEQCSFGSCEVNFPSRPPETWRAVESRNKKGNVAVRYEREFDAEEANEFYQKLLKRPPAFEVCVNRADRKLVVRMNPIVAGHQAAAHLVRGRGLGDDYSKKVDVSYCLSELSSMGEPLTKEFHVPNSDAYEECTVDGMELPLYHRQAKALTRMRAIENGEVEFNEEERSEHILNGIGWCLIGRASTKSPLRGGVLGDAIGSGKTVVTIALILKEIKEARANASVADGKSGATLIVVPPGLVQQWDDERKKFTKNELKSIMIDSTETLKKKTVKDLCEADIVIVPAGIIEERGKSANDRPYTKLLSQKAGSDSIPPAPSSGHKEAPTIEGTWVRNMASGPAIYVGNNAKQKHRDEHAYYGHCYAEAIKKLRQKNFNKSEQGVPLEWFTWNRIVVDECHECLVSTSKQETESKATEFKAQARRGAREFLGVGCTDSSARPLLAKKAVWGLTGTPLLETEARVTELANLMGGTYLTGSSHHWRKEERESGRDIFLNQQEEGSKSREYRCAVQESCHAYVREACQRNRGEKLVVNLDRKLRHVNMTESEGTEFLAAIKKVNLSSYSITPDQLGDEAGNGLAVTASSTARHSALFETIDSIQAKEPDTKIIVFANAVYGGYDSALSALRSSDHKFSHVDEGHSVVEQNEIISWFRHKDATNEDKARPRILLLSFSQAAGHNLQEACHNVIMFDPMYSGSDAVADASVEEQALGRVMRQGQTEDVTCYRILVQGPNGERCLDDSIAERNMDDEVLRAATSNFD